MLLQGEREKGRKRRAREQLTLSWYLANKKSLLRIISSFLSFSRKRIFFWHFMHQMTGHMVTVTDTVVWNTPTDNHSLSDFCAVIWFCNWKKKKSKIHETPKRLWKSAIPTIHYISLKGQNIGNSNRKQSNKKKTLQIVRKTCRSVVTIKYLLFCFASVKQNLFWYGSWPSINCPVHVFCFDALISFDIYGLFCRGVFHYRLNLVTKAIFFCCWLFVIIRIEI